MRVRVVHFESRITPLQPERHTLRCFMDASDAPLSDRPALAGSGGLSHGDVRAACTHFGTLTLASFPTDRQHDPIHHDRPKPMSGKSIRDRLPSLPTRPRCGECGTSMETTRVWHPRMYERVPAWVCPADDCEYRMVRGGDHF